MADEPQEFSGPPSEINIADVAEYTLDPGSVQESADGTVQTFPFTFCFLYSGQTWGEQVIYAPDLDGATVTANQLAAKLNEQLVQLGYPPLCTVRAGSC